MSRVQAPLTRNTQNFPVGDERVNPIYSYYTDRIGKLARLQYVLIRNQVSMRIFEINLSRNEGFDKLRLIWNFRFIFSRNVAVFPLRSYRDPFTKITNSPSIIIPGGKVIHVYCPVHRFLASSEHCLKQLMARSCRAKQQYTECYRYVARLILRLRI